MNTVDLIGFLLQDAFWSALAATGFAILFNVPVRTLPGCALGGAIGHAARTFLMQAGMDIELATLFGAAIIGMLGVLFARRWRVPMTIFTVSAAVTLVPGGFAYRAMMGIIELSIMDPSLGSTILVETFINAIKTALILGAIAAGIAAPRLLFFLERPVV
ncbi:MAG: threonine/serine exporter family protein [Anaerolineae bacterium]|nr:threonine/serine exporter family protein [Anaerolineae bacterium]